MDFRAFPQLNRAEEYFCDKIGLERFHGMGLALMVRKLIGGIEDSSVLWQYRAEEARAEAETYRATSLLDVDPDPDRDPGLGREEVAIKKLTLHALKLHRGNLTRAARWLGVTDTCVKYRLKAWGVNRHDFAGSTGDPPVAPGHRPSAMVRA